MRISLLISSLAYPGGAERVMCTMANYWAQSGVTVHLVTVDAATNDFYRLDANVQRIGLNRLANSAGLTDAIRNNGKRVRDIRTTLRSVKADVLISFIDITNVLALISTPGLAVPVIVSERVHPEAHPTPRSWAILRRLLYPRAAAVVVQTQGTRTWAERITSPEKVHVVPNPVLSVNATPAQKPGRGRTLAAVGRLTRQKGFDLLIESFAYCDAIRPADRLVIVGDGPDRIELEELAVEKGIRDRVHFTGIISHPSALLSTVDVFVLSSRYEGFPNALLEAMALGVPVVSFNCPHGPGDIIRHEYDGLLVPNGDTRAMSEAISRLLTNEHERLMFGERAREVGTRFSVENVMRQWDDVIAAAIREGGVH